MREIDQHRDAACMNARPHLLEVGGAVAPGLNHQESICRRLEQRDPCGAVICPLIRAFSLLPG